MDGEFSHAAVDKHAVIVYDDVVEETTSVHKIIDSEQKPAVIKSADEVLDQQEAQVSNSTFVVQPIDVFVSPPNSRELYSNHHLSANYAKGLSVLPRIPKDFHFLQKMLLMGDCGSGKSSFVRRVADDEFITDFNATIGCDFRVIHRGFSDRVCPISVQEAPVKVKIQLWDSVGPEKLPNFRFAAYRGAMGIFLCFNITDRASFVSLDLWYDEICRYASNNVAVVLLGMKQDLDRSTETPSSKQLASEGGKVPPVAATKVVPVQQRSAYEDYPRFREVSYDEALAYAQKLHIPYIECSAKTYVNIETALATMVHHIFRSRPELCNSVSSVLPKNNSVENNSCVIS